MYRFLSLKRENVFEGAVYKEESVLFLSISLSE